MKACTPARRSLLDASLILVLRALDGMRMSRTASMLLRGALALASTRQNAVEEIKRRSLKQTDDRALLEDLEAAVRVCPADPALLEQAAGVCLRNGRIERAKALYAQLAASRNAECIRVYRTAYMNDKLVSRGKPYVGVLRDVVLETNHCALFRGEDVYWREVSGRNFANHPRVAGRHSPDLGYFGVLDPKPVSAVETPFALLGTDGYNYSHWLSRNVLKLFLLDAGGVPDSLPILVNEDLRAFQYEYVDLLGIPRERLMPVPRDTVLRCSEVLVPTIMRGHAKMRAAIDWLRQRLAVCMVPPEDANDRLFVSRKDAPQRVLLNESELEMRLADLNFKTVTLTGMSVAEQIRTFSKARVIVSAHGSGLTNLVFSPPGAAVVEITNTEIRHMGDFRSIAHHMNQRYIEVVSGWFPDAQPNAVKDEVQKFDYFVNIGDVLAAINEATSA